MSITERSKSEYTLLVTEDYQGVNTQKRNIVDALSMPGLDEIEFDPPRLSSMPRAAQFDENICRIPATS